MYIESVCACVNYSLHDVPLLSFCFTSAYHQSALQSHTALKQQLPKCKYTTSWCSKTKDLGAAEDASKVYTETLPNACTKSNYIEHKNKKAYYKKTPKDAMCEAWIFKLTDERKLKKKKLLFCKLWHRYMETADGQHAADVDMKH